jgi:uracil-DNA glycosylase
VGRLAIAQFIAFEKLHEVIGRAFTLRHNGVKADFIPLPHPSGASPWHKVHPGREHTARALQKIARHPEMVALRKTQPRRVKPAD